MKFLNFLKITGWASKFLAKKRAWVSYREFLIKKLSVIVNPGSDYKNIAGQGTATQIDSWAAGDGKQWGTADKAIDGNTDGVWKYKIR